MVEGSAAISHRRRHTTCLPPPTCQPASNERSSTTRLAKGNACSKLSAEGHRRPPHARPPGLCTGRTRTGQGRAGGPRCVTDDADTSCSCPRRAQRSLLVTMDELLRWTAESSGLIVSHPVTHSRHAHGGTVLSPLTIDTERRVRCRSLPCLRRLQHTHNSPASN